MTRKLTVVLWSALKGRIVRRHVVGFSTPSKSFFFDVIGAISCGAF